MPVWPIVTAIEAFIGRDGPERHTSRGVNELERRESPPIELKPQAESVEFLAAGRESRTANPKSRAANRNPIAVNVVESASNLKPRASPRE